jgi:hypothetical protein
LAASKNGAHARCFNSGSARGKNWMMSSFGLTAATLAVGVMAATAWAQGTGRWTVGAPMPSSRTEIAAAEVGGKIYVVGGFGAGVRSGR